MKTKKENVFNGNIEITKENQKEWNEKLKGVTAINGNLYIYSNCELKAEALTSVGGYLYIYSNCELKALTSVGGYLYIYSNCELKALTSVGGYLYIYSNVKGNIKCLKKINYKIFDNLVFLVESERTSKGIKIYTGGNIKSITKNKPEIEKCFVSEKDNFFAHGETVKKSIQDLQFKIISKKLKNEPINETTELTVKYYRLLTGACSLGCENWLKQNNIPYKIIDGDPVENKPIKAKDLLPILEKSNAWGVEKFKSLINW